MLKGLKVGDRLYPAYVVQITGMGFDKVGVFLWGLSTKRLMKPMWTRCCHNCNDFTKEEFSFEQLLKICEGELIIDPRCDNCDTEFELEDFTLFFKVTCKMDDLY